MMMKMRAAISLATVATVLFAGCTKPASAPTPAPAQPAANPNAGRGGPPGQGAPGQDTAAGRGAFPGLTPPAAAPRPYNRVITAEAKTKSGMFKVHRVADRVYFEIPAKELNKDELMVGRLARAAAGNQTPGPTNPGFGDYAGDEYEVVTPLRHARRQLHGRCQWLLHNMRTHAVNASRSS